MLWPPCESGLHVMSHTTDLILKAKTAQTTDLITKANTNHTIKTAIMAAKAAK